MGAAANEISIYPSLMGLHAGKMSMKSKCKTNSKKICTQKY